MAAASVEFGGILPFDCKGAITSVAPRWKKWKRSFEYYISAKGITQSARKKGLLLHRAGTEVQELFETIQDPGPPADAAEDNADEYQKALRTLDAHFSAQLNEPHGSHVFRNLKKEEGETVDQLLTRLRRQAENCNWDNAGEPSHDQVIDKCNSAELRRKLLIGSLVNYVSSDIVEEFKDCFTGVRKLKGYHPYFSHSPDHHSILETQSSRN